MVPVKTAGCVRDVAVIMMSELKLFFHKVPWDFRVISSDRAIKWACNWNMSQCLQKMINIQTIPLSILSALPSKAGCKCCLTFMIYSIV